ncbi:barren [Linderina pennispora]|uniref:Condensin complex subunit 2 n=1 Tax=Linderina pennispora TaxID=61395 RepID=A0A1Y1WK21_9FUNG|nr:barren [Linderina pennispora]ORX73678.1 barren [Linderina pennispora]
MTGPTPIGLQQRFDRAGTPQTPRVNDDAAERRRRRRSAIERRRSNLVTPHRTTTKTNLFSPSPQLKSPKRARYEEWMKIAADNKINANNTWDFALIDYFYDMRLLKDGDSINFQKASCTLDGCVKIFSSRVDSVASETGRLLSGLAEAPGKRGRGNNTAGEEEQDEESAAGKQKSRRANRSVNTLAKDMASISVKKLDLEFSGGARGLLLNHLSVDGDGKIEIADQSEDGADSRMPLTQKRVKTTLLDLSPMQELFDNITRNLDDAQICPSLADFEFTCDTSVDFSLLKEHLREDEAEEDSEIVPPSPALMNDEQSPSLDDGGDDMGHFLNFDDDNDGPVPMETAAMLQIAEAEDATEQGTPTGIPSDNLLSYFDTNLAKGGSTSSREEAVEVNGEEAANNEEAAGADPKRKRSEKQAFFVDFMNGPDLSVETLFAKPARASAITMTRKAIMNQDHSLPEDVRFSSKNLFNLLLKPRLKFNPRRTGTDSYGGFMVDGDDAANALGSSADIGDETQIGFDDDFDDDGLTFGSPDQRRPGPTPRPMAMLTATCSMRAYARRAKRVNVKKLKDNIWREMALKTDGRPTDRPSAAALDDETVELEGDQKFSDVVSSLKSVYPPEKLSELSVSYCFICLLHLANERNLHIEGDSTLSDLVIRQDRFEHE